MTALSRSKAFGAGFRLIAEKPRVVAVWIGVYLLLCIGPMTLASAWMISDIAVLAEEGSRASAAASMMRLQMIGSIIQLIQVVGGLACAAILSCAVMRALLEPDNDARAYLRLGAQEALVAAVLAVSVVLLLLALMFVLMPIMIAALALGWASRSGGGGGAAGGLLLGVVSFTLLVLLFSGLCARFLPALPMTFAARRFVLFESWTLTRGWGWKLAELFIALGLVSMALVVVVFAIAAIPVGMYLATNSGMIAAWMDGSVRPGPGAVASWLALYAVFASTLGVIMNVVVFAPWVDVYQQLAGDAAPD